MITLGRGVALGQLSKRFWKTVERARGNSKRCGDHSFPARSLSRSLGSGMGRGMGKVSSQGLLLGRVDFLITMWIFWGA